MKINDYSIVTSIDYENKTHHHLDLRVQYKNIKSSRESPESSLKVIPLANKCKNISAFILILIPIIRLLKFIHYILRENLLNVVSPAIHYVHLAAYRHQSWAFFNLRRTTKQNARVPAVQQVKWKTLFHWIWRIAVLVFFLHFYYGKNL